MAGSEEARGYLAHGRFVWAICLVQRTVALALKHGITFYDASYLAVAEDREAVLVTADRKFYRRLPAALAVELLV